MYKAAALSSDVSFRFARRTMFFAGIIKNTMPSTEGYMFYIVRIVQANAVYAYTGYMSIRERFYGLLISLFCLSS